LTTPSNTFTLHSTWRFLRDEGGLDFESFAERLNLDPASLSGDSLKLTRSQLFELWRIMVERVGEQAFIFSVRDLMLKMRFDTVFYAAVCSRDLRSGLHRLSRSKEALFPLKMPISEDKTGLTATFDWFCHPSAVPDGFVLAEFVVFVAMARFATGHDVRPARARLYRLPKDPQPYEDWLGCPLTRGETPALRFASVDLGRPFTTCNLEILQLLDQDLAKRIRSSDSEEALLETVRRRINRRLASGTFDVASIAQSIGLSTRSLQRRLAILGTSYQALLFEVRSELAAEYLRTKLPIPEVAILLGFEEVNSLRRFLNQANITRGHWSP
jgi:AraC-like DNA-binding protein